MSPINPAIDHGAAKVSPDLPIEIDPKEELGQAGLKHQITFVAAKALQCAGAVYTVGTDWARAIMPFSVLNSLKPWLYYGEGVETQIEKRWAAVRQGDQPTANAVLKDEARSIVSTGALLGASSLVGAASHWFWGPTYLAEFSRVECDTKKLHVLSRNDCTITTNGTRPISLDGCRVTPPQVDSLVCINDLTPNMDAMRLECKWFDDKSQMLSILNCNKKVTWEELPHSSWAQNVINFVSLFPAIKTLQEASQATVNTLASSLINVVGIQKIFSEEFVEDPAWKTKLAEISMGLGEAGMISYLTYSGAFATLGMLTPLFILPPVFMGLLAADEMDDRGRERLEELRAELAPLTKQLPPGEIFEQVKKRLAELNTELAPLAKQLEGKLPVEEQAALRAPFKKQIEELVHLQQLQWMLKEFLALQEKEKQAEGLMPKQREWEELHDNKTNKVGAAAYQALRSMVGCFMPFVAIQSAFSTAHLLSSRAITALTGEEKLARWALPVTVTALTVLAQTQSWWS